MRAYTLKKNVLVHDSPPHPVYLQYKDISLNIYFGITLMFALKYVVGKQMYYFYAI